MRQIFLDTETTGLNALAGDRLIEIGAVELIDRRLTGNNLHLYINPEREIEEGAFRVHGITRAFLQDKPLFREVWEAFSTYISGAEILIHNAGFDVRFLDAEIKALDPGLGKIGDYCTIVDTLAIARKKHPGQKNSLDALCKRYGVSNKDRALHGGLLDAQILAHVYLAMTGGQTSLFDYALLEDKIPIEHFTHDAKRETRTLDLVVIHANNEEVEAHEKYIRLLEENRKRG